MSCRILQATAIGDASGAGYEYAPQQDVIDYRFDGSFRPHHLYTDILPGMFTDDALLSYVAGRALVADMTRPLTKKQAFATVRIDTFEQGMIDLHAAHPSNGYSKHVREALDTSKDAEELRAFFDRTFRSDSNGAAMRSAVYGVLPSLPMVMNAAWVVGSATHSRGGLSAAQAVAAASHYFYHRVGRKNGLNAFLRDWISPIWTIRWHERVTKSNGPLSVLTVNAAITAVLESSSLREVILRSIRCGGDTDTVAAIAMGIAVSCDEIVDDLPPEFWTTAIQPVAGLTFADLAAVDAQLAPLAHVDTSQHTEA